MSSQIWIFNEENTVLSQIIEPNQKSLITDLDGSIKFVKKKEGLQDSYDFELELHTYHPKKISENSELLRCCQTRVTMSILSTSLIETEMLQRVFGTSSISTNKSGGFNKITKDFGGKCEISILAKNEDKKKFEASYSTVNPVNLSNSMNL